MLRYGLSAHAKNDRYTRRTDCDSGTDFRICGAELQLGEKVQAMVLDQVLANIANGRAAVGFEFHEALGTYLLEPYED
jgi:hypothetical protein